MRIFIYTSLNQYFQNELRKRLPPETDLIFKSNIPESEFKAAFNSSDILMGNPPANWFTEIPPSLKFWQIDSAGFDQYQKIRFQIPVANMGDFFAHECAETIIAGVLALYRGLNHLIRLQTKKEWKTPQDYTSFQSLDDKRVLILGSGAIGLAVKKILTGFRSQVKTTAQKNPNADIHSFKDVLNHLSQTDLVINTLPGTAENYVSETFINAMSQGSVYANVGRGNTTNEEALITALKLGRLGGAVLDVTEKEPLPQDSPLWDMKNVILTQHTAGASDKADIGRINQVVSNFYKFTNNENLENEIELATGY